MKYTLHFLLLSSRLPIPSILYLPMSSTFSNSPWHFSYLRTASNTPCNSISLLEKTEKETKRDLLFGQMGDKEETVTKGRKSSC